MKRTLSFLTCLVTALVLAGCASSPGPLPHDAADPPAEGSHYANFGTNKVHYVVQGKGKHTILMVHCWAGNLEFWNEQLLALTNKACVVLIDLPGHGQSDKPHTDYTMDFFAQAVLAVMDDAHVHKATLVGHSMGAPVICRVYHQAPERVAGLVAVDGTLRRPKVTPEQAERVVAPLRSADYRESSRQFLATMFPVSGTEVLRDRVISEMLATPQYVMLGAMEGMFGPDVPDWDPGHVNVPVMVINAPNPMWTDEYKQYVHSLSPQTDYYAIENTGHWCMLEKPAEFNQDLVDGLQKFNLIDR